MSGDYPTSDVIGTYTYNGTDNEPEEAAGTHIDDPNGSLYMLCGVLIAMLLVGVIIVLLAVTISKLRKREDNLHTTVTTNHNNNVIHHQQQTQQVPQQQQQPQCQEVVVSCPRDSQESLPPPFLWTNSRCSTTASSQYTLYNNDEDNLVHSVACEEPRECKGLRKNLSGKWRRLVKKKPPQEVYTLPAELRDQLKTIYVY
ncbi:uncharacterized protein LOC128989566 isoform X2 [Macrosteles quadrilineatus]|nr:uncharacterized protein LOC128989566 isoform X2 [Macrosteles quadrilineatus]